MLIVTCNGTKKKKFQSYMCDTLGVEYLTAVFNSIFRTRYFEFFSVLYKKLLRKKENWSKCSVN